MDQLFRRYADPFSFLDVLIINERFEDFIVEFANSENDKKMWDFYLHKVFDKSFDEFKSSIGSVQNEKISEADLETTIKNSQNTLNNFIPIK